ncbi:unnamed protein product [Rotaria magnacalcarata]|uniref:Uncharacterized protein n=1 Tax=Rotaria magnacalcarata TaxID=392030 RepID=A0A819UDT1_9BILA|nr:unnamed protein product [Rotaria magnacalcarata]CAF1655207.1 unnamed protein product [Rotaria magnacalcarata]CAF1923901.1 unnamed protein product [Rotaria magnacalcarata]CAF2048181.1 unnamed protein product [Rotaria magnacalcarata]CAF3799282.1 unnamed protein product [Rotaria magnacalcarata]
MKGSTVLSPCQSQAMRLNRLEYRRLQRDINIMSKDLHENLNRLQRQAQDLRYRYTKFVRLVRPNPSFASWKLAQHGHQAEQSEQRISLESINLKPKSRKQQVSSDETSHEANLPLLVSLKLEAEEEVLPIIDLTGTILRPRTSPMNKRLPYQHRVKLVPTAHHNQPTMNSNRTQPSDISSVSYVSSMVSSTTRTVVTQDKNVSKQKISHNDSPPRKPLLNPLTQKSIGRTTRNDASRPIQKESTTNNRTLRRTLRSAEALK